MRNTRWRGVLAVFASAVAALSGSLLGRDAGVASTVAGGGGLTATITLTQFPCPIPSVCGASASGSFRGVLEGLDVNGKPYTLTFPDPTAVPPLSPTNFSTSSLTFTDNCDPPTSAPSIADTGTGGGTFRIVGGLLLRGATATHAAVLTGDLHFTRAGPDLDAGLSAATVVDGSNVVVASGLLGLGDVTFVVSLADATASCDSVNSSPSTATADGAAVNFA